MSRICQITGKSGITGGGYSNKTRATKFNPTGKTRKRGNIQTKKVFVPEIGKSIKIKTSAAGLRVMRKNGVHKTLKKAKLI